MSKAAPNHYVDNAKFLEAMTAYKAKTDEAKAKGIKRHEDGWPQVDNYIGDCFVKIAKHLAYKANFINYSYRDEMISDGIENCLMYADNFDPAKSQNPFAYFTQITFFAFVRRIEREKKQLATKYRYIEQLDVHELITQGQDDGEFTNQFIVYLQEQLDQVEASKRLPKEKKAKTKGKKATGPIDAL